MRPIKNFPKILPFQTTLASRFSHRPNFPRTSAPGNASTSRANLPNVRRRPIFSGNGAVPSTPNDATTKRGQTSASKKRRLGRTAAPCFPKIASPSAGVSVSKSLPYLPKSRFREQLSAQTPKIFCQRKNSNISPKFVDLTASRCCKFEETTPMPPNLTFAPSNARRGQGRRAVSSALKSTSPFSLATRKNRGVLEIASGIRKEAQSKNLAARGPVFNA